MIRFAFVLGLALSAACAATPKPVAPVAVPTAELAARRIQLLAWLDDYRKAGVFPTDGRQPLSVFVDNNGVRCPMAEMIHLSGRDDLVEAVHRENNAVRLADVHTGPLFDWMLASGLTQEEVTLVQGAMNIDRYQFTAEMGGNNLVLTRDSAPLVAQATIRGKLEMAESMLRANTAKSLTIATQRLPMTSIDALATAPIKKRVLASR